MASIVLIGVVDNVPCLCTVNDVEFEWKPFAANVNDFHDRVPHELIEVLLFTDHACMRYCLPKPVNSWWRRFKRRWIVMGEDDGHYL